MSSSSSSSSFPKLAPKYWVDNVKGMLKKKDVVDNTPICIHKIPNRLRIINPSAYIPQYIGLGPYHHWRDDLHAMDSYKLIALKNSHKGCFLCTSSLPSSSSMLDDDRDGELIIKRLTDLASDLERSCNARIRASYDRHLNVHDDTLAWMMLLDATFLLQFLQAFVHPSSSSLWHSKRTRRLLNREESAYHLILQDIMKLENQIPIFVLQDNILSSSIEISNTLPEMLCKICTKLSPFEIDEKNLVSNYKPYVHLLEALYYTIVPIPYQEHHNSYTGEPSKCPAHVEKSICDRLPQTGVVLSTIEAVGGGIHMLKPVTTNVIPCCRKLWSLLVKTKESQVDIEKGESSSSSSNNVDKGVAPKVEEIEIPSVSELMRVGIKFRRGCGPITTCIQFDKMTRTFYLPKITIDANTEVIIRNLVAYEAVGLPGSLVMARYTELMNGIIDTPDDVRLLRESDVIISHLKSDEEVAQLWNGMSKCIRLSRVHAMDIAIQEVKDYFNNKKRVKFIKFTKDCMLTTWRISMLLLTLVLLVLMAIQLFCDVEKCPQLFGPIGHPPGSSAA